MPKKIILNPTDVSELLKTKTVKETAARLNVHPDTIVKAIKEFKILYKQKTKRWSEAERKEISEKRKSWLAANPEKHPWKQADKFKSVPCENLKEFLRSHSIQFVEEFTPNIPDRNFSIDIAIPEKMIALEVNGNQHYDAKGQLKPYYQERHNLLVAGGWTVHEIHYSLCFGIEKLSQFLKLAL